MIYATKEDEKKRISRSASQEDSILYGNFVEFFSDLEILEVLHQRFELPAPSHKLCKLPLKSILSDSLPELTVVKRKAQNSIMYFRFLKRREIQIFDRKPQKFLVMKKTR